MLDAPIAGLMFSAGRQAACSPLADWPRTEPVLAGSLRAPLSLSPSSLRLPPRRAKYLLTWLRVLVPGLVFVLAKMTLLQRVVNAFVRSILRFLAQLPF